MGEESGKKGWMDDVQAALDRANDALNSAWNATRDTRVRALESAKQAVEELGNALDRGVTVARERWAAATEGDAEPAAGTPDIEGEPPSEEE